MQEQTGKHLRIFIDLDSVCVHARDANDQKQPRCSDEIGEPETIINTVWIYRHADKPDSRLFASVSDGKYWEVTFKEPDSLARVDLKAGSVKNVKQPDGGNVRASEWNHGDPKPGSYPTPPPGASEERPVEFRIGEHRTLTARCCVILIMGSWYCCPC